MKNNTLNQNNSTPSTTPQLVICPLDKVKRKCSGKCKCPARNLNFASINLEKPTAKRDMTILK